MLFDNKPQMLWKKCCVRRLDCMKVCITYYNINENHIERIKMHTMKN